MTIKLWDWERGWKCIRVFEGHSHYVMGLAINPKDTNSFASACLDRYCCQWPSHCAASMLTLAQDDKNMEPGILDGQFHDRGPRRTSFVDDDELGNPADKRVNRPRASISWNTARPPTGSQRAHERLAGQKLTVAD